MIREKNIVKQANELIGKTFKEICKPDELDKYDNSKNKGLLGYLIEEQVFGLKRNSKRESDLPNLEIKTSECYRRKTDGKFSSKSRLVLGMINFNEIITETFEQSHILEKCKNMLIIYYERNGKNKLDSKIVKIIHLTLNDKDVELLQQDYDIIRNYVIIGKAHLLSEKHSYLNRWQIHPLKLQ